MPITSQKMVEDQGDFVLDYVESFRKRGAPCWFIGHGAVAGNTKPIPSGLHSTPSEAWDAAALALGVMQNQMLNSLLKTETPYKILKLREGAVVRDKMFIPSRFVLDGDTPQQSIERYLNWLDGDA